MSSYHSSFLLQFVSFHFLYFSFFGAIMPSNVDERARQQMIKTRCFSLFFVALMYDSDFLLLSNNCTLCNVHIDYNLLFYDIHRWLSLVLSSLGYDVRRHIYGLQFKSFFAQVRLATLKPEHAV